MLCCNKDNKVQKVQIKIHWAGVMKMLTECCGRILNELKVHRSRGARSFNLLTQ